MTPKPTPSRFIYLDEAKFFAVDPSRVVALIHDEASGGTAIFLEGLEGPPLVCSSPLDDVLARLEWVR
jgi:hypothetical protein